VLLVVVPLDQIVLGPLGSQLLSNPQETEVASHCGLDHVLFLAGQT